MSITPYLYYQNVAGALKFLAKAFGFRKYGVQMRRPDGEINHAAMKLGNDLIMMGYPGAKYKNPKRLGKTTQSLYINVDDVDRHFQRAKRAGATILEEPKERIRSTVTAATAPKIPKDISGISRRTFRKRSSSRRQRRTSS
ncbi:MAG: VOC family protein [Candidatus Acidiferrum sp.]